MVLDLHRMTKILEVNEEYGYAMVEPGVSFFDLFNEIQRRGLNLWPSVPAIGWGSVLGNTVDRGFGYTPNGEHSQSQCGMEVVLPNGEILRTGMGAMSNNKAFPLYKGSVILQISVSVASYTLYMPLMRSLTEASVQVLMGFSFNRISVIYSLPLNENHC